MEFRHGAELYKWKGHFLMLALHLIWGTLTFRNMLPVEFSWSCWHCVSATRKLKGMTSKYREIGFRIITKSCCWLRVVQFEKSREPGLLNAKTGPEQRLWLPCGKLCCFYTLSTLYRCEAMQCRLAIMVSSPPALTCLPEPEDERKKAAWALTCHFPCPVFLFPWG